MYRKLLAVLLAVALLGMIGGGVTASDDGSTMVADQDVSTSGDEKLEDGGGGTCSTTEFPVSTTGDEKLEDGGGGC